MKLLIILAASALGVAIASDVDLWREFKETHSKTYKNLLEEKQRFAVFQSSLRTIENHNKQYDSGNRTYFLKLNSYADLTDDEFQSMYLTYEKPEMEFDGIFTEAGDANVPSEIDWREKGAVLRVKNQGHCGSCWAFSTTGALEGQNVIKNNITLPLSEQELIECSKRNAGCNGGTMAKGFDYVQENGISTEESYPYTASNGRTGQCNAGKNSGIKVIGYARVQSTENALKEAVGSVGPISVAINGGSFKFYGGGIFNNPDCPKRLNHGVLAVGYGSKNGMDYWIVKNSWGPDWGQNGYVYMTRNKEQQCGISLDNSFPLLQ